MLRLIQFALRKPITVIVVVAGIVLFSILAIRKSAIDIFPVVNAPTIYVAQTYGGLSPQQMEGFVTSYYEYHFLYITGIRAVESKSIQGLALIKLQFHEGTDMAAAMAEVISYATRARSFMPPGTVPPFVMRYDAGSVPVGQLVFSSPSRSLNEIQDLALFKVRPMFAALAGVSAPPPFGGNQRTVLIKADPERLRSYNITADELVTAIAKNNTIMPAGNIRTGDKMVITSSNSVVDNFKELENVTVKNTDGTVVSVRDLATVDNGADITTGYALINGKRSVYIPVTKRADASTWDVVQSIRKALPEMQAAIPDDIKVSYEFDQSGYVVNSLKSLLVEGLLGALLTGLMVLLFLRDIRSALIVLLTIPLALLSSVVGLYITGQTINIMTLGGLALAIGILVDESTVTVENIHHHLESGKSKARAIWDACREIAVPKLLILCSVLAVFVPALFMSGVPRSMFLPLSLAVGFSMIASFLLSQTLVPVLSNWWLKRSAHAAPQARLEKVKLKLSANIERSGRKAGVIIPVMLIALLVLAYLGYRTTGKEIFPKVDAGQMQVRLRLPTGTRIERTEDITRNLLSAVDSIAGKNQVAISSAFVGLQPPTYAINPIFLYTSGPHEAVIKVNLVKGASLSIEKLKEDLRGWMTKTNPAGLLSFEPADLVDQVMSLGTNNPVEVVVQGRNLQQSRDIAERLKKSLAGLSYLRDLQVAQPLDYPTIQINYDRVRTGQMGLTIEQAGKSVTAGSSSSRLIQPVYWLDKASGNAYQVQVEYPQFLMNSAEQVDQIPVGKFGDQTIYLRDIAEWKKGNSVGEYDRINQQRFITLTANLHRKDLGSAITDITAAIRSLGGLPQGVKVYVRGQSEVLSQISSELSIGLLLAVVVIMLMLAAYFQSFKLSLVVLSVVPAVLAGSLLMLLITGNSLNIQSFMGCIMAIGVAIANAILLVANAQDIRRDPATRFAGAHAAANRLRPIIMTSIAMVAGMLPMSLGIGEGGKQTAPLGIAVIGGLLFSIVASLWLLPIVYDFFIKKTAGAGVSLDPDDKNSIYYDKNS
ncbi:efflux RND transporter permease subunit [Sediminibacterium soli]|uniref:efflux RND transporter permease subunit n=1 Tax=Sediminibacterium soli TaxID=2698829 RepID=UPI00137B3E65|nr:efflux RND transporter permease subunit [Sediminibacterium soli]NCI45049.1 efflux RND transporter permease subunit [Sediminibacterium soli]